MPWTEGEAAPAPASWTIRIPTSCWPPGDGDPPRPTLGDPRPGSDLIMEQRDPWWIPRRRVRPTDPTSLTCPRRGAATLGTICSVRFWTIFCWAGNLRKSTLDYETIFFAFLFLQIWVAICYRRNDRERSSRTVSAPTCGPCSTPLPISPRRPGLISLPPSTSLRKPSRYVMNKIKNYTI